MENRDFNLNVASSLSLDTKVYRIVDFYSAAELITNQSFMIPSSKNFEDSNDGIGQLMAALYNTWPQSGCGVSWKSQEDLEKALDKGKKSSFVSCWSRNPESVAMWSLYSKDTCSIRIETTIEKLADLCRNAADEYNFGHFENLRDGDTICYCVDGEIHDINYRDLITVTQQIKRRVKARKRLEVRFMRNGEDPKKLGDPMSASSKNMKDRFVDGLSLSELRHVKDVSFKHEEEIRVHIPIIKHELDQHFLDTIRPSDGAVKRNNEFSCINKEIPDRIFVKTPNEFVVSVAIDPRAPEYKRLFIEKYFRDLGISIKQSSCFKSAVSYIDLYPAEINPML